MSGPFRELCVELSEEAFALAKGIVEQAVTQAKAPSEPPPPPKERSSVLTLSGMLDVLMRPLKERYGWRDYKIKHDAAHQDITLRVKQKCGHWHCIRIDEERFSFVREHDRPYLLVDELDHHANQRSCTCIPQEFDRCAVCSLYLEPGHTVSVPMPMANSLVVCKDRDCIDAATVRRLEAKKRATGRCA